MNITIHKTTPPPQPPPKLTGFTIELTDREGFILSRILGRNSNQSVLDIANDVDHEPSIGNALIDSPITNREASALISLYFRLNDAFPNRVS